MNCLTDIPYLVCVHHQFVFPSDFITNDLCATQIVTQVSTNLHFEMGPTLGNASPNKSSHLFVRISKPASRGGIGWVSFSNYFLRSLLFCRFMALEDFQGLCGSQSISNVVERNTGND